MTGHVVYGGVPIVQSESAIRAKGPRYYCYYADKSVAHASRPAPTLHPHPRHIPAPLPRPPGSSGHCRHLATKGTMVRIPGFRPDLEMQSFEHFPPKHLPPPPPPVPPTPPLAPPGQKDAAPGSSGSQSGRGGVTAVGLQEGLPTTSNTCIT